MDGCGFSCWHPKWMARFANTRWFMIVYGLLGTIQGTSFLYFVVTLTTIEKRFKIPSQTTGFILSGNEISQIMLSMLLTYFGGQRNRPRWIAWGVVFSAMSCFILAWPHFIYGAGEEALQYTKEYVSKNQNISLILESKPIDPKNSKLCKDTDKPPDDCDEVFSYVPLILIFLSQFVLGIGNTLYYSLGQTYLDDNTKQRNTPLMLSYAFAMRMFGPVLGFGFAYLTMRIYIDPTKTPIISSDDPRWLGAWWLGWIILGFLMFIFAGLIGLFPKHLPKKRKKVVVNEFDREKCEQTLEIDDKNDDKEVNLKNFPKALMRLLKNKLLVFNNIASIFYILGSSGYITFMGRMMEVQFNTSSHGGSIITGPITILGMTVGLLTSGYVIKKYKPPPKYLFAWNAILGFMSMSTQIFYTQIGCDGGNSLLMNGSIISCNTNCHCDGISYSPVCDRLTNTTYFSPCHAGCRSYDEKENVYRDCTCSNRVIPSEIGVFKTNDGRVLNKRSTSPASFLIGHGNARGSGIVGVDSDRSTSESTTNKIMANYKGRTTERQLTFYDVYDEELKLNRPSHDHDETIDANDLYDFVYEESLHEVDDEVALRKRRQAQPQSQPQSSNLLPWDHIVLPQSCVGDCRRDYYIFSFVSMISALISSTGRIGNVLLSFRAVEPRDKAFSQGFSLFMVSLFALIPGPIIFGRTIDSTCLVWSVKCGQRRNCQLYDPIKFRYYLHSNSAIFFLLGGVFDILVWYYGRSLELYGEEEEPKANAMEKEMDETPESQPLNSRTKE